MVTRIRRRLPSPSMVVSMVALTFALGGTSYAVIKLPPRSVGSKQLKPKAVTGTHVKDGSLTGKDINEAVLDKVASAGVADRAGVAGGLDRVVYRVSVVTVPQAPLPNPDPQSTTGVATARCDPGQLVVGGGVRLDENMSIVDSYPEAAGAWTAHVNNDDTQSARNATVYAVCIAAAAAG
jgi:hypothetical protein